MGLFGWLFSSGKDDDNDNPCKGCSGYGRVCDACTKRDGNDGDTSKPDWWDSTCNGYTDRD